MHAEVIASTQSSYVMLEWAGSLKLPLHIAWGKGGNSKKACVSGCKATWDDASGTVKTSLLQLLNWQHTLH